MRRSVCRDPAPTPVLRRSGCGSNSNGRATQPKGRCQNTSAWTKKQIKPKPKVFLKPLSVLIKTGFCLFFFVFIQTLPLGSCVTHTANGNDYILKVSHNRHSNHVEAVIIITIFQNGKWRPSHSKEMTDLKCQQNPDAPTSPAFIHGTDKPPCGP